MQGILIRFKMAKQKKRIPISFLLFIIIIIIIITIIIINIIIVTSNWEVSFILADKTWCQIE